MGGFDDLAFNTVIVRIHSTKTMNDCKTLLGEANRVLKSDGRLIAIMTRPRSTWIQDDTTVDQLLDEAGFVLVAERGFGFLRRIMVHVGLKNLS